MADYTQLLTSVNAELIAEGHAYPLFYTGLESSVRNALTNSAIAAYNAGSGMWPYDWSERFAADRLSDLEDYYAIFPKLFRRLVRYFRNHSSSAGFVNGLRSGQAGENDRLQLVINLGVTIRLADVLAQHGTSKTVRMLHYPEDIVFE